MDGKKVPPQLSKGQRNSKSYRVKTPENNDVSLPINAPTFNFNTPVGPPRSNEAIATGKETSTSSDLGVTSDGARGGRPRPATSTRDLSSSLPMASGRASQQSESRISTRASARRTSRSGLAQLRTLLPAVRRGLESSTRGPGPHLGQLALPPFGIPAPGPYLQGGQPLERFSGFSGDGYTQPNLPPSQAYGNSTGYYQDPYIAPSAGPTSQPVFYNPQQLTNSYAQPSMLPSQGQIFHYVASTGPSPLPQAFSGPAPPPQVFSGPADIPPAGYMFSSPQHLHASTNTNPEAVFMYVSKLNRDNVFFQEKLQKAAQDIEYERQIHRQDRARLENAMDRLRALSGSVGRIRAGQGGGA